MNFAVIILITYFQKHNRETVKTNFNSHPHIDLAAHLLCICVVYKESYLVIIKSDFRFWRSKHFVVNWLIVQNIIGLFFKASDGPKRLNYNSTTMYLFASRSKQHFSFILSFLINISYIYFYASKQRQKYLTREVK